MEEKKWTVKFERRTVPEGWKEYKEEYIGYDETDIKRKFYKAHEWEILRNLKIKKK